MVHERTKTGLTGRYCCTRCRTTYGEWRCQQMWPSHGMAVLGFDVDASGSVHENGLWLSFCLRREALLVRVEVEDLHQPAVAAAGLKLRAA
ncbi:hypothetical protein ACNPQM_30125 [Streptomyces sp. NPDC056231]|uniref:hypothetical protein n=1 Tax=Streptomyces sp. NPDC056231 TaxID=3345755 RepID=UPI003AB080FD